MINKTPMASKELFLFFLK